jgi:hypothetical protein
MNYSRSKKTIVAIFDLRFCLIVDGCHAEIGLADIQAVRLNVHRQAKARRKKNLIWLNRVAIRNLIF